tara:strand:+ start:567 stop:770 length:204 start_codon:yes stop_codon:yes gene_type:complete
MNNQINNNETARNSEHIPTTEELAQIKKMVEEVASIWSDESWYDESAIQEICRKYVLKTNQFSFLRS